MQRLQTTEELQRRLANPLDHNANRVNQIIGSCNVMAADDWTKARAFEDLIAMAILMAMHPDRTVAVDMAREVGMSMLELARKSVEEPIANEPKGESSQWKLLSKRPKT